MVLLGSLMQESHFSLTDSALVAIPSSITLTSRAQARRPLPQYSVCASPAGMAAMQIASTSRQILHLTVEQMSLGEAQRVEKEQGSILLLLTIINNYY